VIPRSPVKGGLWGVGRTEAEYNGKGREYSTEVKRDQPKERSGLYTKALGLG